MFADTLNCFVKMWKLQQKCLELWKDIQGTNAKEVYLLCYLLAFRTFSLSTLVLY